MSWDNLTVRHDAVLASHVSEYIGHPEKLLKAIARHLEPNPSLVVALPNLLDWKYRFQMLFGIFECAATASWITPTSARHEQCPEEGA
jgi:2-polyprenyl-3-methyl-5-hydroxy-6-metoxy-1,4-benzoquinol methylase